MKVYHGYVKTLFPFEAGGFLVPKGNVAKLFFLRFYG